MSNSSILRKLFPKSLSREVLEVFAASPAIKKLGHNDVDDFDYLMILTMCQDFKGELFARGIVFTATDIDCLFEQISEGDGFSIRCTVRTKFEARRKCWFGTQRCNLGEALGAGRDSSEMIALATAQTFAYKAMLKRSSMTYGENDDAEAKTKPITPKESVRIASYQRRALDAAIRSTGIDAKELGERMSAAVGFDVSYEQIADFPRKDFDDAMKLIMGWGEDLTAKWSAAVVDINSKKPQPVVAAMDAAPEEMTGD